MLFLKNTSGKFDKEVMSNENLILVLSAIGVPVFFETRPFSSGGCFNNKFIENPSISELKEVFWGAANAVKVFDKVGLDEDLRDGVSKRWLVLIEELAKINTLVLQDERTVFDYKGSSDSQNSLAHEHYFLLGMLFGEVETREYDKKILNDIILRIFNPKIQYKKDNSLKEALIFLQNKDFNKELLLLDLEKNPLDYLEHLNKIVSSQNNLRYVFNEIKPVYNLMDLPYSDDFNSLVGFNVLVFIKDFFVNKVFSPDAKKFASNLTQDHANLIKKLILSTTNISEMSIEKFLKFKSDFGLGTKFNIKEKISLLKDGFNRDALIPSILNDEDFDRFVTTSKASSFKDISHSVKIEIISRIYNSPKESEQLLKKILFLLIEKGTMTSPCEELYRLFVQSFPCVELFNLWLANTMLSNSFTDGKFSSFLEAFDSYKEFSKSDLLSFCQRIIEANKTKSSDNVNPELIINDLGVHTIKNKNVVSSKRIPLELFKKKVIDVLLEKENALVKDVIFEFKI